MTNIERIKQLTKEIADTYIIKNADYGNSFEKTIDKWGPKIAFARIDDKLNRLAELAESEAKVDESIADTAKDLATYALMYLMWYEKQIQNKSIKSSEVKTPNEELLEKFRTKYLNQILPARKGPNGGGYSPMYLLGYGMVSNIQIKNNNLVIDFTNIIKDGKIVGSGTLKASYPLDKLKEYGFEL